MYSERNEDMILTSFVRWLVGLKPLHGPRYYFERFEQMRRLVSEMEVFRERKICPFCGMEFKLCGPFAKHIKKMHMKEVTALVKEALNNGGKAKVVEIELEPKQ